jgi:hypothetical protein
MGKKERERKRERERVCICFEWFLALTRAHWSYCGSNYHKANYGKIWILLCCILKLWSKNNGLLLAKSEN